MEFDRRVQIRVDRLAKGIRKKGFGSGYLVAPRLVLTAAHVLDDMDLASGSPVTVTPPDSSEVAYPAVVRWQRQDDTVDAALLEIVHGHGWQVPQSLGALLTRPPQRYGLLIGTSPHPVTATGFPRMQKDTADNRRLDEHFTGTISPGTGSLAGRYEISSTAPSLGVEGSRWAGMSGAAVLADDGFGGDLLCGVVRRDRLAHDGTRLTATTAAGLMADEDFRSLITQHTGWQPVLEPIEPAALLTPAVVDRNFRSPAALLRADAAAVAFYGRTIELAGLREWCENGPPAIDIRVVTGPGGQGKTRLARRLTDIFGWRGWVTGHLRSDLTDDPQLDAIAPDLGTLHTALPLLLVVDYAETRPRLLRRLITHLHRSRSRVRLLLLARSDGLWRTGSLQALPAVRDLLEAASVTPLSPLNPSGQPVMDRLNAFRQAAHDLALLLPLVPSLASCDWAALAAAVRPPAEMSDPGHNNALTLQMAALTTVLQHGPDAVASAPGSSPERILLQHEDRFWETSATSPTYKLRLPTPALGAAVAIVALCGASTKSESLQVIGSLPELSADQALPAVSWLASLYPAIGDRYWGSLQPDRLAEYHASLMVTRGDIDLPALLAAAAPGQQAQIVTVLARAAVAHYNAGRAGDSEDVLRSLDMALNTVTLTHQAVQAATDALPGPSRITSPLALRLTAALVLTLQHIAREDPAAGESDLAGALSNLAIQLAEAGRREEALAADLRAASIRHRLAREQGAAESADLATTLSNLSVRLSEVGRREESLTAIDEAVTIYRTLAATDAASYASALATLLSNQGLRLSEAGRRAQGLAAAEEAVELLRRLVAERPGAHDAALAASLSNFALSLSAGGRPGEALSAMTEAVEVCRQVAAANAAAYEPQLALSLSNLGAALADVGRNEEALGFAEQAVEMYRRLADDSPAAYVPGLARSLSNLGGWLSDAGRYEDALAAEEEALVLRLRLATETPAAYEPDLAASLSNLGIRLSEVGRRADALARTEEAVRIYERLAAGDPVAYEAAFARTLSNLGVRLSETGEHRVGLEAEQEALAVFRRLAARNPAAYEPDLAASLSNLGIRLSESERVEEGLAAEQEAVEVYRRLVVGNPTAYEPDLAASLSNLGIQLSRSGRHDEAVAPTEQATGIYRRLSAKSPGAHETGLARSLFNLGKRLSESGRTEQGLDAGREAVSIYERLAATSPAVYEPELAHHLSDLGAQLFGAGHREEGLLLTEQSVVVLRRLSVGSADVYEVELAVTLTFHAAFLLEAGRLALALRAAGEAAQHFGQQAAAKPGLLPQLHVVLGLVEDLAQRLGRKEEAEAARQWVSENPLPPDARKNEDAW
ncbi:tetratricopeptide repeat protein [Streptomyces anulatus]